MVFNEVDSTPAPEPDTSTTYTAATPSETVSADLDDIDLDSLDPFARAKPSSFSVPWPGSIFIIRSISSGEVITLLDGKITLARLGGRGAIHWECVETKGWLGFRNLVTGRLLGHNGKKGGLRCSAERHQEWENFCVRMRPEGGYVLLMTNFESLWPVGIKMEQEIETLAKVENDDGIAWEFIKVD